MEELELYQFAMSHFNEKARWGLDWKGLPHLRHSLLPGPHKVQMMKLSGQDQVPVLRAGSEIIAGSNHILAHLEAAQPEPALVPRDPALAEAALRIQAEFDAEVGPAVRTARFFDVIGNADYFTSQFTHERGAASRLGYRAMFPLVKPLMIRQMDLTAENAERARETTAAALDRVAKEAGSSGYLVGDAFSIADLTAAALLMPAVEPAEGPARPPKTSPEAAAWTARWADHPGSAWVREIYAKHRGTSAEVTD